MKGNPEKQNFKASEKVRVSKEREETLQMCDLKIGRLVDI